MAPAPTAFLTHLQQQGYHPRSDKHSNALARSVVEDLVTHCAPIRSRARAGELVFSLNATILSGTAEWNVDLVLGQPPIGFSERPASGAMIESPPSTVQVAVEFKAVMTEHRKAIKNRKRDFEAHHDHVHRYDDRAIAGGLLVVNASPTFTSPLRSEPTVHRKPEQLVKHCVDQMRAVATRSRTGEMGLDAKGVLVVTMDTAEPGRTSYLERPPAPPVGDPQHYDAFIQAICNRFTERFG